jgi:hypothetical protein
MGIFGKKNKLPQTTPGLFHDGSRQFIRRCQNAALKILEKQGTVTINDVRKATIKDLPDYLNTGVYGHIFAPYFIKENRLESFEMVRTGRREAGGRKVQVWFIRRQHGGN